MSGSKLTKEKQGPNAEKMDVTGEYWVHRCEGTHIFKSRHLPPIILVLGGIITTNISLPVGLQRGMLIEIDQIRIGKRRDTLRRELRLHVSMHQARREKEKAIAMIGGDINVQFSMLWILQ